MLRFIHSSDLHLGKRFGNLPEDVRGRLREARHDSIPRLAALARGNGAALVLLAGDTFDTETPSAQLLRQSFAAMGEANDVQWVIIPGNHDSLLADELWKQATAATPGNVRLALKAAPVEIGAAVVLPAPCTTRRPGRDLSEWMGTAEVADGRYRIGLAHGPVQSFSEDSAATDVIAPDRAQRAGLDYLALGDWHGTMRIGERCWYSGSPEPDRFKHEAPGQALLVSLAAPGAPPEVTPHPVAAFSWRTERLQLLAGDDPVGVLNGLTEGLTARRQTLLKLVASGHVALARNAELMVAIDAIEPDFALFERDLSGLVIDAGSEDLESIDRGGALRAAAEALLAESQDADRSAVDREIARAALARLFTLAQAART
jgi:DNA repair exonuclease SbcCD nuclease subunit